MIISVFVLDNLLHFSAACVFAIVLTNQAQVLKWCKLVEWTSK